MIKEYEILNEFFFFSLQEKTGKYSKWAWNCFRRKWGFEIGESWAGSFFNAWCVFWLYIEHIGFITTFYKYNLWSLNIHDFVCLLCIGQEF